MAIEFVGPRPGEKIHEELFNVDERAQPTLAERIVRAVRTQPLDPAWVERSVERLEALVAGGDEAGLADRVVEVVTERPRTRLARGRPLGARSRPRAPTFRAELRSPAVTPNSSRGLRPGHGVPRPKMRPH